MPSPSLVEKAGLAVFVATLFRVAQDRGRKRAPVTVPRLPDPRPASACPEAAGCGWPRSSRGRPDPGSVEDPVHRPGAKVPLESNPRIRPPFDKEVTHGDRSRHSRQPANSLARRPEVPGSCPDRRIFRQVDQQEQHDPRCAAWTRTKLQIRRPTPDSTTTAKAPSAMTSPWRSRRLPRPPQPERPAPPQRFPDSAPKAPKREAVQRPGHSTDVTLGRLLTGKSCI